MNVVMSPASALLNAELSPLLLTQQSSLRHFLENFLWKEHVSVLVVLVLILVTVFDFLGIMRHKLIIIFRDSRGEFTN